MSDQEFVLLQSTGCPCLYGPHYSMQLLGSFDSCHCGNIVPISINNMRVFILKASELGLVLSCIPKEASVNHKCALINNPWVPLALIVDPILG
jgi:hypothetical protein